MRKFIIIAFFSLGLLSCGSHTYDELSDSRIVEALQEALFLGSQTAASNLSSPCTTTSECLTGYLGNRLVEIAVPDTVKHVLDKINSFTDKVNALPPSAQHILSGILDFNALSDLSNYGNSIKTALNRGAEKAAPNSINVFKNAIFGMSFGDARSILFGNDTAAATSYLQATTYNGLKSSFAPIIKAPLDLLNPNQYWEPIVTKYKSFASAYLTLKNNVSSNPLLSNALGNSAMPSLPYDNLPGDLSEYLAEYATGKALNGLFLMVGKQEAELRRDPWGTVSAVGSLITDAVGDLLGSVFSRAREG